MLIFFKINARFFIKHKGYILTFSAINGSKIVVYSRTGKFHQHEKFTSFTSRQNSLK